MDENTLSRDEMLNILRNIVFTGQMTCLSTEMCLEVEIFTSKGVASWWTSYEDPWPAHCIEIVEDKFLTEFQGKIRLAMLSAEDVDITPFRSFWPDKIREKETASTFLSSLLGVKLDEDGCIYAYYNPDEEEPPIFYSSKDELANKMAEVYSEVDCEWDEMDDDELEHCVGYYEYYMTDMPMGYISWDD